MTAKELGADEIYTVIWKTSNYAKFKVLPGNRKTDASKMKKIGKSIDEIGELPIPIVVNEKMEIVDGQNRLEYCKKMGLPVFYTIVPGIGARECSVINNSMTTWEIKDYIDSYAGQGKEDYSRLRELIRDYPGINMTTLAAIVAETQMGGTVTKLVKEGEYTLSAEREKSARETLAFVSSLYDSEKKLKANGKRVSQMALAWVYENSTIDKKRVQKTFPAAVWRLNHEGGVVVNVSEALELIEGGYNYGLMSKNRCELVREYDHYCGRIGASAAKNRRRR